ncbi:hypothetical protein COV94_02755 [Candidatus Woesearchaeota archaeon CG11_big_fil_rev_8_21_14_0_20_57_5]|nr:MAG: hypothetical protein COV94_02755 [Candidatus Woesearchaeota archaeon CG11_big_fil_rev_8_21_14_0_20_57_5]
MRAHSLPPDISVALIEPQTPENIGAVARSMANFGVHSLIIASPRCDHLSIEARKVACHAQHILEKARIVGVADVFAMDMLVATTSKIGTDYNITRTPVLLPAFSAPPGCTLVFGREGDGLSNEELAQADMILTIPTAAYAALNLSHAVAIVLYQATHGSRLKAASADKRGDARPAGRKEKDAFMALAEARVGALDLPAPKQTQHLQVLRRAVGRMSGRELALFFGLIKELGKDTTTLKKDTEANRADEQKRIER